MSFIKGGIVTRIDMLYDDKKHREFVFNHFNLDKYTKTKNGFLIKDDFFNDVFFKCRDVLLSFSNQIGDSVDNSDSYVLKTSIDTLKKNGIGLLKGCQRYYYKGFERHKFDTDLCYEQMDKLCFRFYFVPIIWDISNVSISDKTFFLTFINNLISSSIDDDLKGVLWFTICK